MFYSEGVKMIMNKLILSLGASLILLSSTPTIAAQAPAAKAPKINISDPKVLAYVQKLKAKIGQLKKQASAGTSAPDGAIPIKPGASGNIKVCVTIHPVWDKKNKAHHPSENAASPNAKPEAKAAKAAAKSEAKAAKAEAKAQAKESKAQAKATKAKK